MRIAYCQNEVIEQSTDQLETADAIRDWTCDGDGKGAVMIRFPELVAPTKPVEKFISNMDDAGVEVIPISRAYPRTNQSAMAHLSDVEATKQVQRQDAWHDQYFKGRKKARDMESYDKTAWQKCEDDPFGDDVLQMLAQEMYGIAAVNTSVADYCLPFLSTNPGKLSYAMHPLATNLLGWFERYKGRRATGTTNPFTPLPPLTVVDAAGKGNIPKWFPLAKVTVECFYASSDGRILVPGGSWDYLTWPMSDPKLVNTEGRRVWLYVASPLESNPDDLVKAIRQVRA